MLDYKLLDALVAVIETGGFERAGSELGLSQSAVSQRIKLLEARLGQPVLVRSPVLQATPAGQRLLNHAQQVQLLERSLSRTIPALNADRTRLRIALNADSLATWWADAIGEFCREEGLLLDLVIEDQDIGLRRMRDGDVAACLCSSDTPVAGARCVRLGQMTYRALARPDYLRQHFPEGLTPAAFRDAPAIVFGPHDQLQHRFLAQQGYHGRFPFHLCPSSEGFVRLALAGMGYGMIPDHQSLGEVKAGRLADLAPGEGIAVDLYWHYWRHGGDFMERLTTTLTRKAQGCLTV
ncbi:LysR family transcriptional regulator ArgP [Marinobacter zhejiangensis]|uniref:LysR family transcriptional regulator, chromosome initiation inhibitor n=1 Tax=Marinobacter zhejiangensis TaxID=488535 RepID=A0A1I4QEN1_9GAMM|nr:LysR family transcriptional regulator ArgP [Marinobacter zhejiangensis]SFM38236.1 LysR family transcriptional regulator, chromosome initiation inhibitor [Marinobacter zhejiangensis]